MISKVSKFVLVLLFPSLAAIAVPNNVTEIDDVESYITEVNSCFISNDLNCISKKMADEFSLQVSASLKGEKFEIKYDKQQYLNSMNDSFRHYTEYSYSQVEKKILSTSYNAPSYSEVVIERYILKGISYEVENRNKIYLQRKNNKLFAVRIEAISKIKII